MTKQVWYQKEKNESWTTKELKKWKEEKGEITSVTKLFSSSKLMETALYNEATISKSAVNEAKKRIKSNGWTGDPLTIVTIINSAGDTFGPAYIGRDTEIQALHEIYEELTEKYSFCETEDSVIPEDISIPYTECYIRKDIEEMDELRDWSEIIEAIGEEDDCQMDYDLALRSYDRTIEEDENAQTKNDKYTLSLYFILDV